MKTAKKRYPRLLWAALISVIVMTGCSTARDVYDMSSDAARQLSEKVMPAQKPLLKKRVLIGPVIDMAGIDDKTALIIRDEYLNLLGDDEYIRVMVSKQLVTKDMEYTSSQYGIILDREHLSRAEETGANVFVSTVFHPLEVDVRKTGIWPFSKYRKVVDIHMTLNAYDINRNTLVATSSDSVKFKVPEIVSPDASKEWQPDWPMIGKEITSMVKSFAGSVSNRLITYPWQGRLTITPDNRITIDGGRDIGASQGQIFEVFAKGESLQSFTGKEYVTLGQKVGEIRLTNVADVYSEGFPVSNAGFADGQIVRIKRQ